MGIDIMGTLSCSAIFVFGYIPNVFNLVFPEGYFIVTKGIFGKAPKRIEWVLFISIIIPFSWIIMIASLFFIRKLLTAFDDFSKDIKISIKEDELK